MKRALKILLAVAFVFILLVTVFLVYSGDYSRAGDVALEIWAERNDSEANNILIESHSSGRYIVVAPLNLAEAKGGIVFYPGGKVENLSYLPLLNELAKKGIICVLAKMPFNLAVFDINAADEALQLFPESVDKVLIGGHSLGGVMASSYYAKNKSENRRLAGVVLLGAYVYGGTMPADALTIIASQDLVLDKTKIDYTENVKIIEGGNHAGFGDYGVQKGDGIASLDRFIQWSETAELVLDFLVSRK